VQCLKDTVVSIHLLPSVCWKHSGAGGEKKDFSPLPMYSALCISYRQSPEWEVLATISAGAILFSCRLNPNKAL